MHGRRATTWSCRAHRPAWILGIALALGPLAACRGSQAAPSTTVPPPSSAPRSITIAATGELLPHPSIVERARVFGQQRGVAYDFAPLFRDIAPVLSSADLAICHLEVPVAPAGSRVSGYPNFGIPAEIAAGIKEGGWDRCSTASNHSNDRGTRGIRATLDALDAAGVGHHGTARTEGEAVVQVVTVGDVRVAHLSYTWGFNGTPVQEPWMAAVIEPGRILADAAMARSQGADLVVLSLHWGNEMLPVAPEQVALADQLLASPAVDLIIGHGPHVLQEVQQHHGKWALMSLGNLVANQGSDRPATYDGVVATVVFTETADGRLVAAPPLLQPTWYDRRAARVRLVRSALADPQLAPIHAWLAASLERTTGVLGSFVAP